MKRPLLLSFLLQLTLACLFGQTYEIGWTTITLNDPDRGNRPVSAEVYYPADTPGKDVPMTSVNTITFPLVVFGHGFVMVWSAYENIWTALVPQGYIVVFPTTEGTLSPSHETFGKDLAFLVRDVSALGTDQNSLLYQRVGQMNCVMGHSMGGGAAYIAASLEPAIKTIATLAPAETTPSAKGAAASLSIPALIIAGSNDCVTPPPAHQIPIYDSLKSPCKIYVSVTGGSHCQMAEFNLFCNIGETSCTPPPAITRTAQHEVINRVLVPWLGFQLKGDVAQGIVFDSLILSDSAVTYIKTCDLITGVRKDIPGDFMVRIFPNPANDILRISLEPAMEATFILYDLAMRTILEETFSGTSQVSVATLQKGVYLYTIKVKDAVIRSGKVIRN